MKKVVLAAILAFSLTAYAQENSFEDFKKQIFEGINKEKEEFIDYEQQIQREFEEYKKIVQQEYENYKKELLRYWDTPEISTKKKYVEYSKNYKVKKVFDFQNTQLKIEIISDKKPSNTQLKKILKNFITEDKQQAFQHDVLSQRIEKKLKEKIKHVKTGHIEKKPLISDIVIPSDKSKVDTVVLNLLQNARIKVRKSKLKGENIFSLTIQLPSQRLLIKAKKYKPLAKKHAKKYHLPVSLVLAITHTESSFNPFARSPVPAYGLMQIVPQTAGKDATKIIFGKPILLSPSFLYNDNNNIQVGTTYLYLLYYRYLKDIKNPISRLYCTIAAYNTGAGNVARAFTGTTNIKKAAVVINSMSPSQVYFTLLKKLPYKETRIYLKLVVERLRIYQNI